MTKEEANQRAEFLQEEIFRAYNLIQYLGGDNNSVTLPRNGDWIKWVANEIYRAAHPDRNMDGAEDFISALIFNQPIWPNSWCQDVAAAAFMLTDGGTRDTAKVREK